MTQLEDLNDDCLLVVLDQLSSEELFKIQRVNQRVNRLAAEKIRTKTKTITLDQWNRILPKCSHLDISRDQVLVLKPTFVNSNLLSKTSFFINLMTKCAGIKSVDLGLCESPGDVLLEAVPRCPELECIKLGDSVIELKVWEQVLDQIGPKIVHLAGFRYNLMPEAMESSVKETDAQRFSTVARNCPNIKRIDWATDWRLTNNLLSAFKNMPKTCHVSIACGFINYQFGSDVFDVVDDLRVDVLYWSVLCDRRLDRLASLKVNRLDHDCLIRGVEFAKLKVFELNEVLIQCQSIKCLVESEFPLLEEFRFKTAGINENGFNLLFPKMPSLKKLTMVYDYDHSNRLVPQFPRTAIYQMKQLETIEMIINSVPKNWKPADILEQFVIYVEGISSLKKLSLDPTGIIGDDWLVVVSEIERMKVKQNQVKIDLVLWKNN